jgi:type II secretory pathway component PulK
VLNTTRNDPQNQHEFDEETLRQARENGCFPATTTVYAGVIADPQIRGEVEKRIDVKSSWFRLRTNIRIGTAEFVLYSVLFREGGNKVRTVQRSFGSE